MITLEELKTYTNEELLSLSEMIKTLYIKKEPTIELFFKQVDINNNFTVNSLFGEYLTWCNENNQSQIDKNIFYKICHNYVAKYKIKIISRTKIKQEKIKKAGDKVSKEEK